jgi:phospholipase/lecithinase/hemolysin
VKTPAICWFVALISSAFASNAAAGYSALYVFGDSLSDSGNNAVVLAPNVTPVPIAGNAFIPTYPYVSGHYTNGEVWAQTFAFLFGLNAKPSLLGGTDFAFGGAQTGPLGPISLSRGAVPPSLETQVAFFLQQHGDVAPRTALYIIAGGGEDVLHALTATEGCNNDAGCIHRVIRSTAASFAENIGTIVSTLKLAGASKIVVWNVPNVGDAPATRALGVSVLATAIASSMNLALPTAIGGDPNVKLFDAFGLLNDVIDDPSAYELSNVTDACAQFVSCDPSRYLFWDGIHPTSAANPIISGAILALVTGVPEPSTRHCPGRNATPAPFSGSFDVAASNPGQRRCFRE